MRDKAAAAKQGEGAGLHASALSAFRNHFTGEKRSHLFLVASGGDTEHGLLRCRDLTPNDQHDVPPFSIGVGLRVRRSLAGLERTGVYGESGCGAGNLNQRADLYAGSDESRGTAGEGINFGRREFRSSLCAGREVVGVEVAGAGGV